MQPTLIITAPAEGMVFINGRFLGEVREDSPLMFPAAPFGPLYLEFRPLAPGWLPMARRIVLSGGAPLADSLGDGLFAVLWPGSIAEIELSPERLPDDRAENLSLEGLPCRFFRGPKARLETASGSFELPRNALPPRMQRMNGTVVLLGNAGDGRYLLTLSDDLSRQTGFLQADRIEFESPGIIRTVTCAHDTAGHGTLERWQVSSSGLTLISSENIWENGIPNRPSSGEEAARAAVEAALLERFDEADSYLAPGAQPSLSLESIPDLGSLCMPMKYPLPGDAPAVALLRLEEENLARVIPLYYRSEFMNGEWRLTELSKEI